jgi:hypothetical protein
VRWTQHAAELFLHSSGGENTIAAVVNPGPASLGAVQVTLKSNGATVSATPPFENWTPLHLPLAACEGGEEVRLLIEVDQLRCPFAVGAHNDLRNLGVMVQRALLYRMTSELVMGEHDPVCYSGAGWYHLEDGLRWTQQSAELFLRASGGEQQLVVETNPGSEKLGPVTVCLRCGEQQQEYLMDRDGWTTLSLALPACEADEMVRVQIEVDRLRCPAEVGLSPDPRSLGVMVRRAALTAAADEMTEA